MTQSPEFRGRIYGDITETIGATPLVRLQRLPGEGVAQLAVALLLALTLTNLAKGLDCQLGREFGFRPWNERARPSRRRSPPRWR